MAGSAKGMGPPSTPAATPKPPRRVRLDTEGRRLQLLEFGKHFFANHAYHNVSLDEVAAAAGVSKGLLFHYFKSKRAFYVETIRAMSLQLRRVTRPDPTLSPGARMRAALDAHLRYAKEDGPMYVVVTCSGTGVEPEVEAILEEHRDAVMGYLLENLGISKAPPLLTLALRAWMVLVDGVCLNWITSPSLERDDVRELLIAAFRALLECTVRLEPTSGHLVDAVVPRTTQARRVPMPGIQMAATRDSTAGRTSPGRRIPSPGGRDPT